MSKRRIAVLIAGMLAGAPIAIAAVSGLAPSEPQPSEAMLQSEATEPADAEQAQAEASAEQTAASEQPAPQVGYVVPARPRTLADATFPPLHSDTFPPSTDERPLPPSVAEYLDRRAAHTLLADAGSREPVFAEVDEGWRMAPVQIAYFDAQEAAVIAAAEARMQAEREVAEERMRAQRAAEAARLAAERPETTEIASGVDRVAENVQQ